MPPSGAFQHAIHQGASLACSPRGEAACTLSLSDVDEWEASLRAHSRPRVIPSQSLTRTLLPSSASLPTSTDSESSVSVSTATTSSRRVSSGLMPSPQFQTVTTQISSRRIARENFGIDRVIARIYDPRRALIYERLGISTVATVAWTTDQVLRKLTPADRGHDWIDPSGKIVLLERLLPDHWAGKRLEALEEPGQFWLGAMTRFGESFIPESKVVGQQGDVLYFTARIDAVATLDERLSSKEDHS